MSEFKKNTLILDHRFNAQQKRHYLNGSVVVLHCHHFTTLYTQLALDAAETQLLYETAEDSFLPILSDYFSLHKIPDIGSRIDLASQYYGAIGLGKLTVQFLGADSGRATVAHSHVDQGWIKKWGVYDKPVNFIGAGYIAASFEAVLGKPSRTFKAVEIQSMVMGADVSIFNVIKA